LGHSGKLGPARQEFHELERHLDRLLKNISEFVAAKKGAAPASDPQRREHEHEKSAVTVAN